MTGDAIGIADYLGLPYLPYSTSCRVIMRVADDEDK